MFQPAGKLAILGGERLRKEPFTTWPQSNSKIEALLIETAKSGKWYRFGLNKNIKDRNNFSFTDDRPEENLLGRAAAEFIDQILIPLP